MPVCVFYSSLSVTSLFFDMHLNGQGVCLMISEFLSKDQSHTCYTTAYHALQHLHCSQHCFKHRHCQTSFDGRFDLCIVIIMTRTLCKD